MSPLLATQTVETYTLGPSGHREGRGPMMKRRQTGDPLEIPTGNLRVKEGSDPRYRGFKARMLDWAKRAKLTKEEVKKIVKPLIIQDMPADRLEMMGDHLAAAYTMDQKGLRFLINGPKFRGLSEAMQEAVILELFAAHVLGLPRVKPAPNAGLPGWKPNAPLISGAIDWTSFLRAPHNQAEQFWALDDLKADLFECTRQLPRTKTQHFVRRNIRALGLEKILEVMGAAQGRPLSPTQIQEVRVMYGPKESEVSRDQALTQSITQQIGGGADSLEALAHMISGEFEELSFNDAMDIVLRQRDPEDAEAMVREARKLSEARRARVKGSKKRR